MTMWTVARFQDGSWTADGDLSDSTYVGAETFRVSAQSRESAKKKAQDLRRLKPHDLSGPADKAKRGRTGPRS